MEPKHPLLAAAGGGLDQSATDRKQRPCGYVDDGRLIGGRGVIFPGSYRARGRKWLAIYSDEESFMYLASPMATKKLMAEIVSRWPNPPLKLRPEKGAVFSLHDMQDENHSHVYLVQLLTFHQTAEGQYYYKIGKAKSIPRRIKQFGPCRLVRSIKLPTEQVSLKVEAELETVVDEYMRHEASENS
jgi:hypothetical protein